jgi:TonB family protein
MAICPNCGSRFFQLYEDAGSLCPRCATTVVPQPVRVTPLLLGLIVLVYVAMVATGVSPLEPNTDQLLAWGADFGPLTLAGQGWRLVSSMFLHGGLVHLAFNGWALWTLGRLTERFVGAASFALIYLLSGIAGNLASLLINPIQVSVGASGAIFGAAGALVSLQYLRKLPATAMVLKRDLAGIGTFVLYNLAYGFTHSGIDNSAHVGGLLTGLALGAVVPLPSATGEHGPRLRTLTTFGVASALLALGADFVWHTRAAVAKLGAAVELLNRGQTDSSIAALQEVVTRWPRGVDAQYFLGVAYLRAGRAGEAVAPLRAAAELQPANPEIQFMLGNAYLATQAFVPAVTSFDAALTHAADSARVYIRRAVAYRLMGRAEDARADLGHTVSLGARVADDSALVADARRQLLELDGETRAPERPLPSQTKVFKDAVVDVKPAVLSFASPEYPERLRMARIGGRVLLECVLDTSGSVEPKSVKVLESPDTALSRAATTALLHSKFRPARLEGRAVRVLINLPIDFNVKAE